MSASASSSSPRPRIDLVDALRGSALLGLFLLHCVEHFEMGGGPKDSAAWLQALNSQVRTAAFFLFGGKAYGIFAFMFGLSFFLQLDGAERRGEEYRGRFVWRLLVLAALGYINGLVFCGDILMVIAVLGLPLVLLYKASNRLLVLLAALLLLQLPQLCTVGRAFVSGYQPPQPYFWGLYGALCPVYADGSWSEVLALNVGKGQTARFWFTFESGRYVQMLGLFLCGLLVGRSRVLEDTARVMRFARRALLGGAVGLVVLYPLTLWAGHSPLEGMAQRALDKIGDAYLGLAQMAVWMGGFILLYHGTRARGWLRWLAPYGRMSLTNYVTQGLFWVPFYYGFGLGMHRYLGEAFGLLAGIPFLLAQLAVSHLWLRHYRYGPLEWFWRCCTRCSFALPLHREPRVAPEAILVAD